MKVFRAEKRGRTSHHTCNTNPVSTKHSTEIPYIPDLEDEDDITRQVAEAPEYHHPRVQTLKELEHDSRHRLPKISKTGREEIDLYLLSQALPTAAQVVEDDVPWTSHTFSAALHGELGNDVLASPGTPGSQSSADHVYADEIDG